MVRKHGAAAGRSRPCARTQLRSRDKSGKRRADERAILSAETDIAWAYALAGQPEEALRVLDALVERVHERDDDWITHDVLWAYSAVFAVLGRCRARRAPAGLLRSQRLSSDWDRPTSQGDAGLAERAYGPARERISPQAWDLAREHGATLTAAQAFVVAQAPRRGIGGPACRGLSSGHAGSRGSAIQLARTCRLDSAGCANVDGSVRRALESRVGARP